jgi:phosphoglycerate-specific signal transduction histidine kinase
MAQAILRGLCTVSRTSKQLETKNRELHEAQSQLVQAAKQAAMGQLVAGVAHEINTPLGTINSNFDVTSRALNLIREELARQPSGIGEKSRQLFATIDSLMEVNRVACARIIRNCARPEKLCPAGRSRLQGGEPE